MALIKYYDEAGNEQNIDSRYIAQVPKEWRRATGADAVTDTYDVNGMIEQLNRAKESAIVSGLTKARDTQLSNLADEETTIKPQFYKARNAVSAGNQLGRRTLAEELARRGETNSGVSDEATIRANMSLDSKIGDLKQQEVGAFADNARRKSGVLNAFESDLANAKAGLQTASLSEQIAEMRRQDELARQDARYAKEDARYADERDYNRGRDDVADTRYDTEVASEREKAERKDYTDTILRFYNDFTAERNRVRDDGDPSNDWQIPLLETEIQKKTQDIAAGQQSAADAEYDRAMDMWKARGVADDFISRILGVPVGARTASYDISKMQEQRLREKPAAKPKSTLTNTQYFNQAIKKLDEKTPTGQVDSEGKPILRPKYTRQQYEAWLANLPIDDKTYDDLILALDLDSVDWYAPSSGSLYELNR